MGWPRKTHTFRRRGCHPLRPAFPCRSSRYAFCNFLGLLRIDLWIPQPRCSNARKLDTASVWADPLSLAATKGVEVSLLSCRYLDVSVPCVPYTLRCFQEMSPGRFPDFGDLRITACSAAPRSFSQLSHVLHRLWTPRHPPCTLCSLTTLFSFSAHYPDEPGPLGQ